MGHSVSSDEDPMGWSPAACLPYPALWTCSLGAFSKYAFAFRTDICLDTVALDLGMSSLALPP